MLNYDFSNKNVFITGGTSGIGLEIAISLNSCNSNLIISGRNEEILSKIAGEFKTTNPNFTNYFKIDLCKFSEIEGLVNKLDPLDGLILNAGVIDYTPSKMINENKIRKIFDTNVFSNILLIQNLLKQKKISKKASIVFISSISAKIGVPGTALYSSSKSAINSYANVLASELSGLRIRVNVVSPGVVKTNLIADSNVISEEQYKIMSLKYPLGLGHVKDVSNLVLFLLSDESNWITGSNIVIDGGYLLNN